MTKDCSTCIHKEGSCYPPTTIFDKDKTCKSYEPDYEKYIAGLEAQIERNKIDLAISEHDREHDDYEFTEVYKKVERLEKENAKLKGEADSVLDNWCKGNDPCPHLKKRDEQLTKAKELLKWALHSDPEHDEDFEKKWEEAEKFLKDCETEKC